MAVVSVYCVFADNEEADHIGRTVVEEGLAACINILSPCRSFYRWKGKIEQAAEVPAILKTSAIVADRLLARIVELHSYDVPAVVVWPVERLFSPYGEWVESETQL